MAKRIRQELADSLRATFGAERVRECDWKGEHDPERGVWLSDCGVCSACVKSAPLPEASTRTAAITIVVADRISAPQSWLAAEGVPSSLEPLPLLSVILISTEMKGSEMLLWSSPRLATIGVLA